MSYSIQFTNGLIFNSFIQLQLRFASRKNDVIIMSLDVHLIHFLIINSLIFIPIYIYMELLAIICITFLIAALCGLIAAMCWVIWDIYVNDDE